MRWRITVSAGLVLTAIAGFLLGVRYHASSRTASGQVMPVPDSIPGFPDRLSTLAFGWDCDEISIPDIPVDTHGAITQGFHHPGRAFPPFTDARRHKDAACWQIPLADGWFAQHFGRIHILGRSELPPSATPCLKADNVTPCCDGFGPSCDMAGVRACAPKHEAGLVTPCGGPKTGEQGCARCGKITFTAEKVP
jgi:hypothetical protein